MSDGFSQAEELSLRLRVAELEKQLHHSQTGVNEAWAKRLKHFQDLELAQRRTCDAMLADMDTKDGLIARLKEQLRVMNMGLGTEVDDGDVGEAVMEFNDLKGKP
jgi:hypothetical protein